MELQRHWENCCWSRKKKTKKSHRPQTKWKNCSNLKLPRKEKLPRYMSHNWFPFCSEEDYQLWTIRPLRFIQCKRWEISELRTLSRCQKYAENWWGVTFTKSHSVAAQGLLWSRSSCLSAANQEQTPWLARSAQKTTTLILGKVITLCVTVAGI